jgi:hypothetical protein
MIKPKTHFQQVPLEIVKGIVEKQSEAKIAPVVAAEATVPSRGKTKPRTFERRR